MAGITDIAGGGGYGSEGYPTGRGGNTYGDMLLERLYLGSGGGGSRGSAGADSKPGRGGGIGGGIVWLDAALSAGMEFMLGPARSLQMVIMVMKVTDKAVGVPAAYPHRGGYDLRDSTGEPKRNWRKRWRHQPWRGYRSGSNLLSDKGQYNQRKSPSQF